MPIYTKPRVRQSLLEEFVSTEGQVFGAIASDALTYSPTSSILRMSELSEAEEGKPTLGRVMPLPGGGAGLDREEPDSPLLDADAARERVKDAGVNIEVDKNGIRERALDVMIKRAEDDKLRQFTISQGPGGAGFGAKKIGVMLAASMLDPINIASAFVPVVGPARYATMIARAGGAVSRTGVRAGVGAVEGVAGAAAVEPVILMAARQEQADYDSTDSFLNIAFGTVFGGGLHVMGGGAMDVARFYSKKPDASAPPESVARTLIDIAREEQEALLRTAVVHSVSGQRVNVDPIWRVAAARTATRIPSPVEEPLNLPAWLTEARKELDDLGLDGASRRAPLETETPGAAERLAEDNAKNLGEIVAAAGKLEERLLPDAELARLQAEADKINASIDDPKKSPKRRAAAAKRQASRLDEIKLKMDEQVEIRRLLDEIVTSLDPAITARINAKLAKAIDDIVDRVARIEPIAGLAQPARGGNVAFRSTPTVDEVRAQATAQSSPENSSLNDMAALRAADEQIKDAPTEENEVDILTDEAVEDVQVLARQMDEASGSGDAPATEAVPARAGRPHGLSVEDAPESVHDVMEASFEHGRAVGDEDVPINSLEGGTSVNATEGPRVDALVKSIEGPDGFIRRLIVDTEGNVIEGQHRLEALRRMGVETVPVTIIEDLTLGFDMPKLIAAVAKIKGLEGEQRRQIIQNSLEMVKDAGSVEEARLQFEMPDGLERQFDETLEAIASAEKAAPPPTSARAEGGEAKGVLARMVDQQLAAADELAVNADEYGRAVRALAECQVRRG